MEWRAKLSLGHSWNGETVWWWLFASAHIADGGSIWRRSDGRWGHRRHQKSTAGNCALFTVAEGLRYLWINCRYEETDQSFDSSSKKDETMLFRKSASFSITCFLYIEIETGFRKARNEWVLLAAGACGSVRSHCSSRSGRRLVLSGVARSEGASCKVRKGECDQWF